MYIPKYPFWGYILGSGRSKWIPLVKCFVRHGFPCVKRKKIFHRTVFSVFPQISQAFYVIHFGSEKSHLKKHFSPFKR